MQVRRRSESSPERRLRYSRLRRGTNRARTTKCSCTVRSSSRRHVLLGLRPWWRFRAWPQLDRTRSSRVEPSSGATAYSEAERDQLLPTDAPESGDSAEEPELTLRTERSPHASRTHPHPTAPLPSRNALGPSHVSVAQRTTASDHEPLSTKRRDRCAPFSKRHRWLRYRRCRLPLESERGP